MEVMNMAQSCVECGKRLGVFEGYRHPVKGMHFLVCSQCFLQLEESLAQWRSFILENSFLTESPHVDFGILGDYLVFIINKSRTFLLHFLVHFSSSIAVFLNHKLKDKI
jgi:hypothetical protein